MARIQRLAMFLEAHFEVELHMPEEMSDQDGEVDDEPSLLVRLDEAEAKIGLISMVRHVCNCIYDIPRVAHYARLLDGRKF